MLYTLYSLGIEMSPSLSPPLSLFAAEAKRLWDGTDPG